MEMSCSC
jgi:hypothetical protein